MGERSSHLNIEKKIVARSTKLSSIAKKAIATTFGLSAAFTLNACDDSSSPTSGQVVVPIDSSSSEENHEPLGNDVGTKPIEPQEPPQTPTPESSNSDAFSSSSKYLDIPQSHEAISSEVFEALSSAAQSATSSVTQPLSSAVQPPSSSTPPESPVNQSISSSSEPSSSADQPTSSTASLTTSSAEANSSATQQQSSAAQPTSSSAVPTSSTAQPASSSATAPASSAVQPASSSYDPWGTAVNPCDGLPAGSTVETDFQVIICPDSSNSSWPSHGFSMVTTFERDDIEV